MGGLVRANVQIDYVSLAGVLPMNANFSDIDGILERNCNFLFIETKFNRAPLSRGQEIMLKHLARMPNTQIWIISIEKDPTDVPGLFHFHPNALRIVKRNGTISEWETIDLDTFKTIYQDWWKKSSETHSIPS